MSNLETAVAKVKLIQKIEHYAKIGCFDINKVLINDDFTIDVDGGVSFSSMKLYELPLSFRSVTNGFDCSENHLTSLKGCPIVVGGSFSCADNNLTNLVGGPEEVGGRYCCEFNCLTSLEGAPRSSRSFVCSGNDIKSLEHMPKISSICDCSDNPLESLKGLSRNIKTLVISHMHNNIDDMNIDELYWGKFCGYVIYLPKRRLSYLGKIDYEEGLNSIEKIFKNATIITGWGEGDWATAMDDE